jgi:hypothetical protein
MTDRFVVLGASNVSRGLARLAATVRARAGTHAAGPADLFVAAGHGRGYAVTSRVGLRRLPSILASGLWRALDREQVAAPAAVVMDVGNELLYGLRDRGGRIVILGLPLAGIARVGPLRYRLMRTVYVPGCPLALGAIQEGATWLDEELRAIAADAGATFIEQPAAWYGFDALHVARPRLDDLWQRVGDAWALPPAASRPRATFSDWAAVGRRAAEVRSIGRRMRRTPQPAMDRHGLRVWMY